MTHTGLKHFWRKPIYLPYLHEPLTDEKLAEFEQKIGYRLPKTLVELLKIQNGGYTRYCPTETTNFELWGIGDEFPKLFPVEQCIDFELADYVSFDTKGLIAFNGTGNYFHCLDYRSDATQPKIAYVDIECDVIEEVADSFDAYLQQFSLDIDEYYYVVASDLPLGELIAIFAEKLAVKYESLGNLNNGYSEYRMKVAGYWVFAQPNRVPMAFARKGEHNFDKLAQYAGKTTLLYPEIDENYSILKIFNEKSLTEILQKLGDDFVINRLDAQIK